MFKITHKLSSNSGQHTLEYAMIMILVMAGIIIATPYVIRSWNANMQGWEDTVVDSYQDPLLTAPDTISLPGCSCGWTVGDPNFDCGPVGGCAETELSQQCVCTPTGCGLGNPGASCVEGTYQCNPHPLCCSTPVGTGLCGPPDCPNANEMLKTFSCGNGPVQQSCFVDTACTPGCVPPINQPANSDTCPGYGQNLSATKQNALAADCNSAPPDDHCIFYCLPPYFPQAGNTLCGLCPAGSVLKGNCPAGECEQTGACSSNQCPLS